MQHTSGMVFGPTPRGSKHPQWYNSPVVQKNWQDALSRTKRAAFGRLSNLLGTSDLTSEFWDELEAVLIQADLGVTLSLELLEEVRERASREGHTRGEQIHAELRSSLMARLVDPPMRAPVEGLEVIVMVGVNGSGKTTSAARLANFYKKLGKVCILAAADTYRAAATEQLMLWAGRLEIDIIHGEPHGHPQG